MALAMETMDACLGAWFARLLPTGEPGDADLRVRGRVALALGDVAARWPGYFMRESALPVELVRVMRETDLGRAPDIKFSNMAPRPAAREADNESARDLWDQEAAVSAATARSHWATSWQPAAVAMVVPLAVPAHRDGPDGGAFPAWRRAWPGPVESAHAAPEF